MSNVLGTMTSPLGSDKVTEMVEEKKRQLEEKDLEKESDIMYFKGHLAIKDL